MASRASTLLFVVVCLGVARPCTSAPERAFRGTTGFLTHHTVAADEVETSLQEVFETLRAGGRGSKGTELAKIEASIWQTFQALPKNSMGRVAPPAVRYVVHKYFAKEHGWLIRGLEPTSAGPDVAEHKPQILQDRAPAFLEALLENRQSGNGLALEDIVAMVATLEHLVLHESVSLLEASYYLNNQSSFNALGAEDLEQVLLSYIMLFGQGSGADLSDPYRHQELKSFVAQTAEHVWATAVDYEHDALMNYDFTQRSLTNPFTPRRFSFDSAVHVVQDMAHGYGKWQNGECVDMKEALVRLDPRGTGRVSLGTFYSESRGMTWQFSEPVDTLRQLGILDESSSTGPQVLIANYLAQPTNCIATSSYYSVCCLNECEAVMNDIEKEVQAPTASADRILRIVSNISTDTVEAPREIPRALARKLREVAASQGGDVTLHGRLFSQWLHFAFPNECAYPHTAVGTLTASEWFERSDATGSATMVEEEERRQHVEAELARKTVGGEVATAVRTAEAEVAQAEAANATEAEQADADVNLASWSDEDQHHFAEPSRPAPAVVQALGNQAGSWRQGLRLLAQLGAVAVVAKTAHTFMGSSKKLKVDKDEKSTWFDIEKRHVGKRTGFSLPI